MKPGTVVCGHLLDDRGYPFFLLPLRPQHSNIFKLNIRQTNIMASGPITSWQIDGETVSDFIFWAPKSLQMVTAATKLKDAYSLEEKLER